MAVRSFYFKKITNGLFVPKGGTTAIELGCTGSLSSVTEFKTLTLTCEGAPKDKRVIPSHAVLTVSAHWNLDAYDKMVGFNETGLATGVQSYGENSQPAGGALIWELQDMYDKKRYRYYPYAVMTSGDDDTFENGLEEVPEKEATFEAMKDEFGEIYYNIDTAEAAAELVAALANGTVTRELLEAVTP